MNQSSTQVNNVAVHSKMQPLQHFSDITGRPLKEKIAFSNCYRFVTVYGNLWSIHICMQLSPFGIEITSYWVE